jgi:hypothetical protein
MNPNAHFSSRYGRIPGRFAPAENAVFWDRWLPQTPQLGHYVPPDSITRAAMVEADATVSSMATIAGQPYVFKNVYMTLSLPALFRLLPKARAIVITRDLAANIASVYKKRRTLSSWWSIQPPLSDEVSEKAILEQTVFQCIRSEQLLQEALRHLPAERCMVVDYEALCGSPVEFIERVDKWMESALRRRREAAIPTQFTASKGPGLSSDNIVLANGYRKLLEESRLPYLSRVRTVVEEHFPDGQR